MLISNPLVLIYAMSLTGSERIAFERDELLLALAGLTVLAIIGAVLMAMSMDPSYRRSFFGRLSLNQYVGELWETRTYAPIGSGIDASRAHLLKFSR